MNDTAFFMLNLTLNAVTLIPLFSLAGWLSKSKTNPRVCELLAFTLMSGWFLWVMFSIALLLVYPIQIFPDELLEKDLPQFFMYIEEPL